MPAEIHPDIWSIAPPLVAVVLAFLTREALLSLLAACVAGLYIAGDGLWGLPSLLQRALGTPDFIWVVHDWQRVGCFSLEAEGDHSCDLR